MNELESKSGESKQHGAMVKTGKKARVGGRAKKAGSAREDFGCEKKNKMDKAERGNDDCFSFALDTEWVQAK